MSAAEEQPALPEGLSQEDWDGAVAWLWDTLHWKNKMWVAYDAADIGKSLEARRFRAAKPRMPLEIMCDEEEAYRRGFHHGIQEALEHASSLYKKKGFTRTSEIVNILWNWSETIIRRWRYDAVNDTRKREFNACVSTPQFKHESWAQIKARVFKRDGTACLNCHSRKHLEAHHLEAVTDGGLPIDDNLETLCRKCRRG